MKARVAKMFTVALILFILSIEVFAQDSLKAPSVEVRDLQGHRFRLADYKGKVVLVNFWATWCSPCRTEIPELIRWQREYRHRGLQVIGITYPPQTLYDVRRFTSKWRINYPVAMGTRATKLEFTPSETLPMTVVIDAEGNVRDVIEGIVFAEEFDQKIKPLLAVEAGRLAETLSQATRTSARLQSATILVDEEGYQPTNVKLRRGIPTRLTFIRKVVEGCGTEIAIPAYGINRRLPLNDPVVVSFTPNKSGRFKLTCGMDMFRGSLIVR